MFQYIGAGEVINIFVLPFIGLAMSLVWYARHRKEDKGEE